jgi:hypothetical protein
MEIKLSKSAQLGPHLRMANPEFNQGFTPRYLLYKREVNPGLNPGFGVLRFGLWEGNLPAPLQDGKILFIYRWRTGHT